MTIPSEVSAERTMIAVSTIAECPFSIAEEYAAEYLRSAEAGGAEAAIRVRWPLPLPALQHRVALTFGLHLDVVEEGRKHDEIHFHWSSGSLLLPDFRGKLRFRIEGKRTRVLLEGSYIAPLGPVGRQFDRLIGKRMARASLDDLAARIAGYLGRRERAWRRAHSAG